MSITFTPVSPLFGAEVSNVDLGDLNDEDATAIDKAWCDYGVLFFRDQQLTPEQHIAFAQRFAEIDINKFFSPVEGHPNIAEVLKEPDQKLNIGGGWHTDHSYDVAPARGSILLAKEVPAAGGDTLFASSGAAYDSLSEGLKNTLGKLRAVHSNEHVFGAKAQHQREMGERLSNPEHVGTTTHPVVIAHPQTGRPLLYVNPGFTTGIEGWSEPESKMILDFLFAQMAKVEHTLRFRWEEGSMALWDNRSTWHMALNDYHGQRRYMHRITISGDALEPAA